MFLLNKLLRTFPINGSKAGNLLCLILAARPTTPYRLSQRVLLARGCHMMLGTSLNVTIDNTLPHWVRTATDIKIYQAKSDTELWDVCRSSEFTVSEVVSFLSALSKFIQPGSTVTVDQIQKPYSTLYEQYLSLQSGEVMLALRSLLTLGIPADDNLVNLLRIRLVACLHHFGLASLIMFACFHVRYATVSSDGRQCQQRLIEVISSQLDQVVEIKLLLLLMTKLDADLKLKNLLHKRMLFLLEAMDSEELLEFVQALSLKQQRMLPLLTYATERIGNAPETLLPKQAADLLSSLVRLNYRSLALSTKLCNDLKRHLCAITDSHLLNQIVFCIGMLRFDDEELLNRICEWYHKHDADLQPNDYCPLLVTLAHCNFRYTLIGELIDRVHRDGVQSDAQWLNFVWALSVLRLLSSDNAQSVLSPQFVSRILGELGFPNCLMFFLSSIFQRSSKI
ncbi:unnamed protein product [Soboliphyme baturini]|uniref:RAP domain-containing protein n=1 Tax=Soboliphyme baturini TaxID=241478 RepID=A0A183J7Y1_9BILA|nr:unnamed protein product [Soboliphyme baturini]